VIGKEHQHSGWAPKIAEASLADLQNIAKAIVVTNDVSAPADKIAAGPQSSSSEAKFVSDVSQTGFGPAPRLYF